MPVFENFNFKLFCFFCISRLPFFFPELYKCPTINLIELFCLQSAFSFSASSCLFYFWWPRLQFEFGCNWIKICVYVVIMRQTQTAVQSHCVCWRPFRSRPVWAAHLRHHCWFRPKFMHCWFLLTLDLVSQMKLLSHQYGLSLKACNHSNSSRVEVIRAVSNKCKSSDWFQIIKQSFQTKCTNRSALVPVTSHSENVTYAAAVTRYLYDSYIL